MRNQIVFVDLSLPKTLVSDAGTNFVSEQFKDFLQVLEYKPSHDIIIPPPKKWTGGDMHKLCEMHHKQTQKD